MFLLLCVTKEKKKEKRRDGEEEEESECVCWCLAAVISPSTLEGTASSSAVLHVRLPAGSLHPRASAAASGESANVI